MITYTPYINDMKPLILRFLEDVKPYDALDYHSGKDYAAAVSTNDMGIEEEPNQVSAPITPQSDEQLPKAVIEFADEETRVGREIYEAVDLIVASMPPEGAKLKTTFIAFDPEHELKGLNAIYAAGTVIGTGREDLHLVPERTLEILGKLGIPYRVVTSE